MQTTTEDPFALFEEWMAEATAAEVNDPNAMSVATATPEGAPAVRILLLKGLDPRGFVFFSHDNGRKGHEMAANPRAALCFHWKSLRRQIRIEGAIERVSDAEADAYYASRPRLSRIGAWASRQTTPLGSRAELEAGVAAADARFPGEEVPRPPHWGGFRCIPSRIEFWRDMPFRLHERRVFFRAGTGWAIEMLYP
ncbi:pyridoxamine 5'-phosphate oxidase [Humitalea rosea]|uniref:Pyridoxine/pyridoxamine 5'-phosphate oxidase n=1 Tax=Humitalea rosea TaxID=990373 RepID=A0A2W7IAX6_9PROT|nr:pyridoxamine 5'-phosphate oxidase [Humitalea rosea]PZW42235.1 pyridoxamine 5'-phosphate oxidase [Humitalea rosea]